MAFVPFMRQAGSYIATLVPNILICRRQVERQAIWLEAALGRPGQVIAMAFGAIPTVIGGPAVLVAVRIGVTESVPPVT